MTENQIIDKVRVILNEAGEENSLALLTEDTVKLGDYIRESIPDAVTLIQMNSPLWPVNKKSVTTLAVSVSNGGGVADAPRDFVRLINVMVSDWKRQCCVSLSINSEAYKQQCNSYTRTGVNKPLCFYGHGRAGKQLYLYPFNTDSEVSYLNYEASYSPSSGLDLDANDPVFLAVCYMTASLVYTIFENKASADAMAQIAIKYIPTA